MAKRLILPVIFGFGGVAVLLWLGTWQLQRLAWKQELLADIEAKMMGEPQPWQEAVEPVFVNNAAVKATGVILPEEIHYLTSRDLYGPGFRIIAKFETEGRTILIDRGFVQSPAKDDPRPEIKVTVTGNLVRPNEVDPLFTPDPDLAANIWFARDVPAMAAHLGTEPVLLVVRTSSEVDSPVSAWPISTEFLPNNHLQYAVTWYLMALAWFGMTAYLLWRIRRQPDQNELHGR